MATRATSALVVSDWQETALPQPDGGVALARSTSEAVFTGDFTGKGTSTLLLVYPPTGVASFAGVQTFEGTLAGRSGTFVLQQSGTFQDSTATVRWSVVPGSATGELAGLRGEGGYESPSDAPAAQATLDYEID
jgi:Protein of unknown function (DUF3224)